MSEVHIESNGLETVNRDLTTLKTDINAIWKGSAATSLCGEYDTALTKLTQTINQIEPFNTAVTKLEEYKANKLRIEELNAQIANERANPSLKTTETYTVLGVTKSRTVYVVDEAKISTWQKEIDMLTEKNLTLKNEINAIIASITGVDASGATLGLLGTDATEETGITGLINSAINAINNLLPKNNSDISHRGYTPGGIIDNTAEGFILAGEKGFWGCETDVRFDSNGNLVCSHNTVTAGQNPTSFSEYLDICKEYGMTAIIDLKYEKGVGPADPYLSPAVIQTINEKGMINSCVIQTNNTTDIPYIRQTDANARIWYLTDVVNDKTIQVINENNVECVNIRCGDNNNYQIQKLTANGTDVCVWNVFSEDAKNRRLQYGATYVMSDNVLGITPYQAGEKDFNNIAN